jgi:NADH-quinone oxidoreductase E subunit
MADLHPDNPYAPERFADTAKKVEFPPEAKTKFDWILTRYPNKEAALLPTLHLAQETWGWISPEAVHYVGELLDLSPATVFGVVSFYNMYNQKPVGKYHVQVCTNLSCMIGRAYDIYEGLCEKMNVQPGQTTPDGKFTIAEVECLGSCGTAPVVQINNDYHENMTVEKVDALLKELK